MDTLSLDLDGVEVVHVERGEGVPVLYVHGNLGSHLWWDRVMDIPGARTVALDLPNFGRSGPLGGEVSIARYAEALSRFIEAKGLDRPVLVGHSLGGCVIQALVAARPGIARGLVLVDSGAPSGLVTPVERHPAIEMMRTNPQVLAMALKAVVPTLADEAFLAALVEEARRMAEPAWIGNAVALGRLDLAGKLRDFTGPVLVIHGGKDLIITPAMAAETVGAFPRARLLELPEVGHSVIAEDPEAFRAIMEEYLARL